MKILNLKIDWKIGWANSPDLIIEVDEIPEKEEYLFDKFPVDSLSNFYLGHHQESDTYRFLYHHTERETGFSGSEFQMKMRDRTIEKVKGPWASRASVASQFSREPLTEVYLQKKGDLFFHERSMTLSKVKALLPEGIYLIPRKLTNEVAYEISDKSDEISKPSTGK